MKIIDLLVKIANGEDIPKRIRYCSVNYKYDVYDYFNEDEDDGDDVKLSYWIDFSKKDLNYEIEIIEDTPKEDNNIEKDDLELDNQIFKYNPTDLEILIIREMLKNRDKINEIIDRLNGDSNE